MEGIATENLAKRDDCTKHILAQTKKTFSHFPQKTLSSTFNC